MRTYAAEALEATIAAGTDMAGFVFFEKSQRHLDFAAARREIAAGRIRKVALSVDAAAAAFAAMMGSPHDLSKIGTLSEKWRDFIGFRKRSFAHEFGPDEDLRGIFLAEPSFIMPAKGNRYLHGLLATILSKSCVEACKGGTRRCPARGERAVALSARHVYIPICRKTL